MRIRTFRQDDLDESGTVSINEIEKVAALGKVRSANQLEIVTLQSVKTPESQYRMPMSNKNRRSSQQVVPISQKQKPLRGSIKPFEQKKIIMESKESLSPDKTEIHDDIQPLEKIQEKQIQQKQNILSPSNSIKLDIKINGELQNQYSIENPEMPSRVKDIENTLTTTIKDITQNKETAPENKAGTNNNSTHIQLSQLESVRVTQGKTLEISKSEISNPDISKQGERQSISEWNSSPFKAETPDIAKQQTEYNNYNLKQGIQQDFSKQSSNKIDVSEKEIDLLKGSIKLKQSNSNQLLSNSTIRQQSKEEASEEFTNKIYNQNSEHQDHNENRVTIKVNAMKQSQHSINSSPGEALNQRESPDNVLRQFRSEFDFQKVIREREDRSASVISVTSIADAIPQDVPLIQITDAERGQPIIEENSFEQSPSPNVTKKQQFQAQNGLLKLSPDLHQFATTSGTPQNRPTTQTIFDVRTPQSKIKSKNIPSQKKNTNKTSIFQAQKSQNQIQKTDESQKSQMTIESSQGEKSQRSRNNIQQQQPKKNVIKVPSPLPPSKRASALLDPEKMKQIEKERQKQLDYQKQLERMREEKEFMDQFSIADNIPLHAKKQIIEQLIRQVSGREDQEAKYQILLYKERQDQIANHHKYIDEKTEFHYEILGSCYGDLDAIMENKLKLKKQNTEFAQLTTLRFSEQIQTHFPGQQKAFQRDDYSPVKRDHKIVNQYDPREQENRQQRKVEFQAESELFQLLQKFQSAYGSFVQQGDLDIPLAPDVKVTAPPRHYTPIPKIMSKKQIGKKSTRFIMLDPAKIDFEKQNRSSPSRVSPFRFSFKQTADPFITDTPINLPRPDRQLFRQYLDGSIDAVQVVQQTHFKHNVARKNKSYESTASIQKGSKFTILSNLIQDKIKKRMQTQLSRNEIPLQQYQEHVNVRMTESQKQLKQVRIHYNHSPTQSVLEKTVKFKTKFINESNQFMRDLKQEKIQRYIDSLLVSRRKLQLQIKKEDIEHQERHFKPLGTDYTMRDVKLYNYLYNDPSQNEDKSTSQDDTLKKTKKRMRSLKFQKTQEDISEISNDCSLQSVYEFHLDQLYDQQKDLETKLKKGVFDRLQKKVHRVMRLQKVNEESISTSKRKLRQSFQ